MARQDLPIFRHRHRKGNQVIKIDTNLVTLPVTVLDRNGRFVSGVNQREFKIFENGAEQQIEYFFVSRETLYGSASPRCQPINPIQDRRDSPGGNKLC